MMFTCAVCRRTRCVSQLANMQAYMKLCTDNESVTLQSIKTMQGSKKQLKVPAAANSNNCIVLLTNVDAVCMYTL